MNLSLSKRDKVLLVVLAVVVVIMAYYYLIFAPVTKQISEKRDRHIELVSERTVAEGNKAAIANTIALRNTLIDDINAITSSYYPYVPSQYFADMMNTFSSDLGLKISDITINPPSLQDLSSVIPKEDDTSDPFASAIKEVKELENEPSSEEDSKAEDEPASDKPGKVAVNKLSFSVSEGNVERYLAFLDKLNNTPRPIYVSKYEITFDTLTNKLIMNVAITIVHLYRVTESPIFKDAGEFNFEPLPPAGSENNFIYDTDYVTGNNIFLLAE